MLFICSFNFSSFNTSCGNVELSHALAHWEKTQHSAVWLCSGLTTYNLYVELSDYLKVQKWHILGITETNSKQIGTNAYVVVANKCKVLFCRRTETDCLIFVVAVSEMTAVKMAQLLAAASRTEPEQPLFEHMSVVIGLLLCIRISRRILF